jgi:hypothetical protein
LASPSTECSTAAGKSRKHSKNSRALWRELEGVATYRLEDLAAQRTVANALRLRE